MRKGNTITLNTLRPNVVRMNGQPWAPGGPAVGGGGIVPLPPTEPEEPEVPPVPTYVLAVEVQNGSAAATLGGVAVQLPYTANEGDTLLVTITPAEGYTFEAWADGATDNPRAVVMTADVTLSAACAQAVAPNQYIQFEDPEAERVLMANGVSSDGIGITLEDAERVTSISTWFKGNTSLVSFNELRQFEKITRIEPQAFKGCSALVSVGLPEGLTYIGYEAFSDCVNLTGDLDLPKLETIDGNYYLSNTFKNTKIDKVINIGKVTALNGNGTCGVFNGCAYLTEAHLPETLAKINGVAFKDCQALSRIICRATTPPSLNNDNAFSNTNNCPIFVPDASVEAYKTATNWNSYADRIRPLSEIDGSPYIQFEDPGVESFLMSKGVSSDGIGITKADAEAVTSIGTWFTEKKDVSAFPEFAFFTGVKSLVQLAFLRSSITKIAFPPSLETINSRACDRASFSGSLILPHLKGTLGLGAFYNTNITEVISLGSITTLEGGDWTGEMLRGVFANCPNLRFINFPSTTTSIGACCWSWCGVLEVIICNATTPPEISATRLWEKCNALRAIYVPSGSVEAYKTASNWAGKASIIKALDDLVTADAEIYNKVANYLI